MHYESASHVAQAVQQAESIGDYLSAFDIATRGIDQFPDDQNLKYLAVRAMARAGSPERASSLYGDYGLECSEDVDIASLQARIAKDQFLAAPSDPAPARLSATLYESIFERSGDHYPGINAATMWQLSGDRNNATALARRVIDICQKQSGASEEERYWLNATIAEGALLLGDVEFAAASLRDAAKNLGGNFAAAASTVKQLRHICRAMGLKDAFLELLPIPGVIFYAGHMISPTGSAGRFPSAAESTVAARIAEILSDLDVGFGYGSLASGADILFAEALLDRGAELHAVLPFDIEEFKSISVAPAGEEWTQRFDCCLARASSVVHATEGAYLGHDVLFAYAAKIGMGLARIRSRGLETKPQMVAVWDGEPARGDAGTAIDIAYWQQCGLDVETIDSGRSSTNIASQSEPAKQDDAVPDRLILPVLFGDVKGFSKLLEQHLPVFTDKVMAALAETIHGYEEQVLFTNTWGDAVHIVFGDFVAAARCALEMQESLNKLDLADWDLPDKIGMRISLHIGPVFVGYDHVNREKTYFGRTLTRAARMEPVTPVGEVFVTEQFAALIEMERGDHVHCTYVGDVPLAKDFGSLRMYRLERIQS